MSLLMDALKRAEKARQEEDARKKAQQDGRDPNADTGGMSLDAPELTLEAISDDDLMEIGEETIASTPAEELDDPLAGFARGDSSAIGLSDSSEMRAVEEEILSGKASLDASLEDTADWDLGELQQSMETGDLRKSASLSMDYSEIPLDETGATLPSMRSAQRSVDDYFDGTQSMSMSMEQLSDGTGPVSGETTDQRYVDTTRRTAKALLEDGAPVRRQRTGLIAALVLIPLLLIVIGGGAYVFKDEIIALIDGQPTGVAQRPPPVPAPSTASAPATPVATAPATPAMADQIPGMAAESSASQAPLPPAASVDTVTASSEAPVGVPAGSMTGTGADAAAGTPALSEAEQAAFVAAARALEGTGAGTASAGVVSGEIDTGMTAAAAMPAKTETMPAPAPAPEPEPEDVSIAEVLDGAPVDGAQSMASVDLPSMLAGGTSGGLKITRRRGPSRIQRRLMDAYEAYNIGDDAAAATLYQRVLAARPNNRDALLGMAAIYMRGGARQQAEAAYGQILRRNPRDSAALSGLMAVQQRTDPGASESRLKSMLAEQPGDPQLHFSLGNAYAQQRRWPEAQVAYFDAYRLASDNPDYAFNLAVSLDQLRQRRAAAGYYRKAVELGESGHNAAFDLAAARVRADTLEGPR